MHTWSLERDADIWINATSKTIKQCINDAIASDNLKSGDTIYIGECRYVGLGGIDFSSVLESVEQDMYEQVGEASESWDISSIEYRKEIYNKYEEQLYKLVKKYIKEIKETPNFYHVVNIKPFVIK